MECTSISSCSAAQPRAIGSDLTIAHGHGHSIVDEDQDRTWSAGLARTTANAYVLSVQPDMLEM